MRKILYSPSSNVYLNCVIQWQLKPTLLKIHFRNNIYSLGNDDIQGYNSKIISNRKS